MVAEFLAMIFNCDSVVFRGANLLFRKRLGLDPLNGFSQQCGKVPNLDSEAVAASEVK